MLLEGKMSKDTGMGVHKGTVVSFVPTFFGYFLGIPSLCPSIFVIYFCDLTMRIHQVLRRLWLKP